jgi:hypothetical protein
MLMNVARVNLPVFLTMACLACTASTSPTELSETEVTGTSEMLFIGNSVWNGSICVGDDECFVADVDGDGHDDAIAVSRGSDDIWVARSTGSSFSTKTKWMDTNGCQVGDRCFFDDMNNDGRADLLVINGNGNFVALSNGTSFDPRQSWGGSTACAATEECHVGDVDGDHRADIVAFVKDSQAGGARGDVYVSLAFVLSESPLFTRYKWHDWFCIGDEICDVADFDGDGRKDIVTFLRSTSSGAGEGDVYVALSNGGRFGTSSVWNSWFCIQNEDCQTADIDHDGKEDLVSFVGQGDVWVGLSTGAGFSAGELWRTGFGGNGEVYRVGNVGGRGGGADALAFTRDGKPEPQRGDVNVSLSEKLLCAQQLQSSTCTLGRWPNGVVYYAYSDGLDDSAHGAIRDAMDRWQDTSAHVVRFERNPGRTDKVTIKPCTDKGAANGYDGCHSGCTAAICDDNAVHELGHVLGFRHQQQRQDRDHYVRINRFSNCGAPNDEERCNQPNVADFGPYDFKSTMQYGPTDPDIERWDGSAICENVDPANGACLNDGSGPGQAPTPGDGAAVVELYRSSLYSKFKRTLNVADPSPYSVNQAPFDEVLATAVSIAWDASPAVETWEGGSLAIYLRGTDRNVYKKSLNTSTQQWTSWQGLGSPSGVASVSDPGVVSWAAGRTDVVVRGDASVFIMSTPTWGSWQSLGSPPNGAQSAPVVTSWGPNHLDVFVRAADDKIYHKWCGSNCSGNSGGWSNWDVLGTGTFLGKPAVTTRSNNTIEVFGHGMDDKLWQVSFNGSGWGNWGQVPANGTLGRVSGCADCASPAAASRGSANIDVYVHGTDDKVWVTSWNGSSWSGYSVLGGVLSSSPGTVSRVRSSNRSDIIAIMPEGRRAGWAKQYGTWWKTYTP